MGKNAPNVEVHYQQKCILPTDRNYLQILDRRRKFSNIHKARLFLKALRNEPNLIGKPLLVG